MCLSPYAKGPTFRESTMQDLLGSYINPHCWLPALSMTNEQFSSGNPGAQLLWRAVDVQQLAVGRRWPDDRNLVGSPACRGCQ